MFIEGLSDWEKRRLALVLKERGQTAFMVVKHATAAVNSGKRGRKVNAVDQQYLDVLDKTIDELYGYQRVEGELRYAVPNEAGNQSSG